MRSRAVVVATGAWYRTLDVPGLAEFEGTSVFHAATLAEAQLCAGDPVVVVGGGNSAGQAALFLADHAAGVQLVVRGGDLGAHMSRYLVDQVLRHTAVAVYLHNEVREVVGAGRLDTVVIEDNRSGQRRRLPARGMFVFVGARPRTDWLDGLVALDDQGFVRTGPAVGTFPDGRAPL